MGNTALYRHLEECGANVGLDRHVHVVPHARLDQVLDPYQSQHLTDAAPSPSEFIRTP